MSYCHIHGRYDDYFDRGCPSGPPPKVFHIASEIFRRRRVRYEELL